MKLFILYAILLDGERHMMWIRRLPADFDWVQWGESRKQFMKLLGIRQFIYEEVV